ncbi:hypothetical protein HMI55_003945, partial [Coelomomyces lativittatus]
MKLLHVFLSTLTVFFISISPVVDFPFKLLRDPNLKLLPDTSKHEGSKIQASLEGLENFLNDQTSDVANQLKNLSASIPSLYDYNLKNDTSVLETVLNAKSEIRVNISSNSSVKTHPLSSPLNFLQIQMAYLYFLNKSYLLINASDVPLFPFNSNLSESRLPLLNSPKYRKQSNDEAQSKSSPKEYDEHIWLRVIKEDFSKGISPIVWKTVVQCTPEQLTCFSARPKNLDTKNRSLIISPVAELNSIPRQYTSARIYTTVHWPLKFERVKVKVKADLPNVDSVVPILALIMDQTHSIQLAPPVINQQELTNITWSTLPKEWEVTLNRRTGQVWFGDHEIQELVPSFYLDSYFSIVLSSVIRTSDVFPN